MAPASTKRVVEATHGSATKRAKPQREPMFDGIKEALEMSDLPVPARGMLNAMVPGSLGVVSEDRCPVQVRVMEMIGEVFTSVQARLEKEFAVESESAAGVERSKEILEKEVVEATARLAETEARMESKKCMLADLSGKAVDAAAALQAAELAYSQVQDMVKEISVEKSAYEVGIAENLKLVKEGVFQEISAKDNYGKLVPLLANLDLDESLRLAAPSVCQRLATARGSFDQMVLEQVEHCLVRKVDALGSKMSIEEANASQRRKAVIQAKTFSEKLQVDLEGLAVELTDASKAQEDSVIGLQAAVNALEHFGLECSRALELRDVKKDALESFLNYNVSCYEVLKTKTNVKPILPTAMVEACAASRGAEQT